MSVEQVTGLGEMMKELTADIAEKVIKGKTEITEDTPLTSSGLVDSFALIEIFTELQRSPAERSQPVRFRPKIWTLCGSCLLRRKNLASQPRTETRRHRNLLAPIREHLGNFPAINFAVHVQRNLGDVVNPVRYHVARQLGFTRSDDLPVVSWIRSRQHPHNSGRRNHPTKATGLQPPIRCAPLPAIPNQSLATPLDTRLP